MKLFKLAIIGCGGVSPMHFDGYAAHPERVRVVAVCDPSSEAVRKRNGWTVDEVGYYRNPWRRVGRADGLRPFLVGHAANLARATLGATGRLAPYWSDGIIVWARPAGSASGSS